MFSCIDGKSTTGRYNVAMFVVIVNDAKNFTENIPMAEAVLSRETMFVLGENQPIIKTC